MNKNMSLRLCKKINKFETKNSQGIRETVILTLQHFTVSV